MTAVLSLLLIPVLLPLAWEGAAGHTYTVQMSDDLQAWETLPGVIEGAGNPEALLLDIEGNPGFARLRSDPDGDTNGNGLPDLWEWQAFGMVDIEPDADPDLDGLTNFHEWQGQSDPLDFFNGVSPVLLMSSGYEWLVPTGSVSSQAISLTVLHPSGQPWPGAPVRLAFPSGYPGLVGPEYAGAGAVAELIIWTDSLGRVHPGVEPVHLLSPKSENSVEVLAVTAGSAMANLSIISVNSTVGDPPRDLRTLEVAPGEWEVSWMGSPEAAETFIIEQQEADGQWSQRLALAAASLPAPEDGRYRITLLD